MSDSSTVGDSDDGAPEFVVVLVPSAATADPSLDYYNDYTGNRDEFARAFAELGVDWRWQPVTALNYREVIDAVIREHPTSPPLVFNLCDGDESNDVPGVAVIRYLDELRLTYTGADAAFYEATTSKITMKSAFDVAGVRTPTWAIIEKDPTGVARLFERLGTPLIVKPAVGAGSMGITIKSVVDSDDALRHEARLLHEGYHGWNLASGGVLVEQFIDGPEFTTFIVGSADDPERSTIYPPVERVFHSSLPARQRLLSYDRLWEVYEREEPLADDAFLWEYGPAPEALSERLKTVSWAAYVAMGGCGYGRVDLRMDARSGTLYVLEVNAQCGLSEDENSTSIGAILRFGNRSFARLVREIIDDAIARS